MVLNRNVMIISKDLWVHVAGPSCAAPRHARGVQVSKAHDFETQVVNACPYQTWF